MSIYARLLLYGKENVSLCLFFVVRQRIGINDKVKQTTFSYSKFDFLCPFLCTHKEIGERNAPGDTPGPLCRRHF